MPTVTKTIEKTFSVKIATFAYSPVNIVRVIKDVLKVSVPPQSESQTYLDSTNAISIAIFPKITKITNVIDFDSNEFFTAYPKQFGSGTYSSELGDGVSTPKTLTEGSIGDESFVGGNGSQTNDVNLEANLTTYPTGNFNVWSADFAGINLTLDKSFTYTVYGYTFYPSNPHVQVVAVPAPNGGYTFNVRINPAYAHLYTSANNGQSLGTVYAAVNIDGSVYNTPSVNLYFYVDPAVANKSLTPEFEVYPNTTITNAQYSINNGSTWSPFTTAVSVPAGSTCKVKATFSKTAGGIGYYTIDGGGYASINSSAPSYTLTSSSFTADADKYIIFYSSKSGQRA